MFVRIAVGQLPPFQLIFIRTTIAAVGLNAVLFLRGKRWPTDGRSLRDLLFLGIFNTVMPFALITWGEKHIPSNLAGVLQGCTALFSLVIAHFAFADERITRRKLAGLFMGFAGVVLLATRRAPAGGAPEDSLATLGQLALILSSVCYAVGGSFSRAAMKQRLEPIMVSAGTMTIAAVVTGVITYFVPAMAGGAPVPFAQMRPQVLGAILMLGVFNTFVAYLIFYTLVSVMGASRSAMITYVLPVVSLVLGAVFLREVVDARLLAATALILGGIAVVNRIGAGLLRRRSAPTPQQTP